MKESHVKKIPESWTNILCNYLIKHNRRIQEEGNLPTAKGILFFLEERGLLAPIPEPKEVWLCFECEGFFTKNLECGHFDSYTNECDGKLQKAVVE